MLLHLLVVVTVYYYIVTVVNSIVNYCKSAAIDLGPIYKKNVLGIRLRKNLSETYV